MSILVFCVRFLYTSQSCRHGCYGVRHNVQPPLRNETSSIPEKHYPNPHSNLSPATRITRRETNRQVKYSSILSVISAKPDLFLLTSVDSHLTDNVACHLLAAKLSFGHQIFIKATFPMIFCLFPYLLCVVFFYTSIAPGVKWMNEGLHCVPWQDGLMNRSGSSSPPCCTGRTRTGSTALLTFLYFLLAKHLFFVSLDCEREKKIRI